MLTRAVVTLAALSLSACHREPKSVAEASSRGNAAQVLAFVNADPLLLEEADVTGQTPLRIAARDGNLTALDALLRRGALVDGTDGEGRSALHLAAAAGHTEEVQKLLEKGATWTHEDAEGRTPLLAAVHEHHSETAHVLRDAASGASRHRFGGPPSKYFGKTVREAPKERRFVDDAVREWGKALEGGVMFRLAPGAGALERTNDGGAHAVVIAGNVRASAKSTNDVDLDVGGMVTIPKKLPHGYACLGPDPCLVYEETWALNEELRVLATSGAQSSASADLWANGVCSAKIESQAAGSGAGTHDHAFEILIFMLGGTMRYSIDDDAPKMLPPGSLVIVPAGVKHALTCDAGAPCLRYYEQCGG